MQYVLRTPPGWYQAVMTLKMTCGRAQLYPGFVDIRSRQAASTDWLHEYHAAGATAEQNITEVELKVERDLEKAVERSTEPPTTIAVPTTEDGSIVGDVAELLRDLLYVWKDDYHPPKKSKPSHHATKHHGITASTLKPTVTVTTIRVVGNASVVQDPSEAENGTVTALVSSASTDAAVDVSSTASAATGASPAAPAPPATTAG